MPAYTFTARDVLTGTILGDEMPLSNVQYDLRVNDAAAMTASLSVDAMAGPVNFLEPARTAIYVDRGGSLAYAGIMWDEPDYDSSTRTLQISCLDFLSYWDHLLITDSITYAAKDQLAIARSLCDYGMNKGGSNLAPTYVGPTTSGVNRDRNYLAADQAPIGQRLRELSAVDNGFDFRIYAQWENGYPRRVVQFGYPTLGRPYPASAVVFDLDVDCTKWTRAKSGSTSANVIYATGSVAAGATAGTLPPTYTADDASVRAAGYPRLESSQQFAEIITATPLQQHAKGALNLQRLPVTTMQLTMNGTSGPDLGEYLPGDQCKAVVGRGDGLFRYGAEIIATITSVSVSVDSESNDTVTVGIAPSMITEGVAR